MFVCVENYFNNVCGLIDIIFEKNVYFIVYGDSIFEKNKYLL